MTCCCSVYGIIFAIITMTIAFILSQKSKKSQNVANKHVVITGGSQGIGKATAIEAAKRGAHVTILARNHDNLLSAKEEILKSCTDTNTQVITEEKVNVTDFGQLEKVLTDIDKTRPIDILVNCAGMAICGKIEDIPQKDVLNLVNLNLLGTYFATKTIVPLMKGRNSGIIIMTASQAALAGIYGLGIYSATKFALRGLAETVHMEIQPYNMSVTLALPPDTDTPGFERENVGKPKETMLISESGGLFQPDVVASKMLDDALMGKFYSSVGFESFLLTTLSCGMSPFNSYLDVIIQSFLLGPIRFVTSFYVKKFEQIVKDCKTERDADNKNKKE